MLALTWHLSRTGSAMPTSRIRRSMHGSPRQRSMPRRARSLRVIGWCKWAGWRREVWKCQKLVYSTVRRDREASEMPSSVWTSSYIAHRPRAAGSEAHPGASVMETLTPLTPLSILAVEDNPADIYTVQRVLRAHALAYDLQVIDNADHAFAFFSQLAEPARCPDILLLDLNLPQRNGKELLQHLKAIPVCAAMRVVIFTSSHDPADRAETLALGADVFFEKPFHLADFLPLGTLIKTLAMRHASVHTPAQASHARYARSVQLRQESKRLRQESQALVARVQVLCARSRQLLRRAAMRIVKERGLRRDSEVIVKPGARRS